VSELLTLEYDFTCEKIISVIGDIVCVCHFCPLLTVWADELRTHDIGFLDFNPSATLTVCEFHFCPLLYVYILPETTDTKLCYDGDDFKF
jgi:hypothetical protein